MLKRFEKVTGSYIETIAGQKRFAFSHSDTADFYDLPERLQYSSYPGSVLCFYDLVTGKVYQPFDKRQNILMVIQSTWKTNTIFYRAILTAN